MIGLKEMINIRQVNGLGMKKPNSTKKNTLSEQMKQLRKQLTKIVEAEIQADERAQK